MRGIHVVTAIAVISSIGVGTAKASLVVGNWNAPFNGTAALSFPQQWAASSFTLESGFTPANLGTVNFAVGSATPGMSADGYLCFDNAGKPGAIATSLGSVAVPQNFAGVSFSPSTAYTLEPNRRYWVVLSHQAGSGDLQWIQTQSTAVDSGGSPMATIQIGSLMSSNSGASWFPLSSNRTFKFAVNATPIPEPATGILIVIAVSVGVIRRRW